VIGILQGLSEIGVNQTAHWEADRKSIAKYNGTENKIKI
jgi:hypothetical protein